jgi:hypothetical protein
MAGPRAVARFRFELAAEAVDIVAARASARDQELTFVLSAIRAR